MKDWAIRCLAESTLYEENYFLTLTYNDYNLRFNSEITSPDTGCTYCDDGSWGATLVKADLVKFNKDLRRYFEYHYEHTGIRFYNCGEYGGQNGRPHYHGIYFNLPIPATELIPYKLTTEGMLYKCPMIEKIWGKGFITVAEVTINSCCYVAGYVMKKMRNDWGKEYYYQSGVIPEFNNMSRVPGIGKAYYDSHKEEIYSTDELIINGNKYGRPKPPRYFDKLYDIDYPTEMALIKEQRQKCADEAKYLEASKSTISAAERNKLKASELDNKTRILKRRANIENDNRKCKLVQQARRESTSAQTSLCYSRSIFRKVTMKYKCRWVFLDNINPKVLRAKEKDCSNMTADQILDMVTTLLAQKETVRVIFEKGEINVQKKSS